MAPPAKRKPLALDSNILFDLADELDAAHRFREEFQSRGYSLLIPPTVTTELTLKWESGGEDGALALKALQCVRQWGLQPIDLIPAGHGIAEEFARRLISKGLLPDDEFDDGLILAETSLAEIPMLVTSDHHLLDIERDQLEPEFAAADLDPVAIVHPRALVRALY